MYHCDVHKSCWLMSMFIPAVLIDFKISIFFIIRMFGCCFSAHKRRIKNNVQKYAKKYAKNPEHAYLLPYLYWWLKGSFANSCVCLCCQVWTGGQVNTGEEQWNQEANCWNTHHKKVAFRSSWKKSNVCGHHPCLSPSACLSRRWTQRC